MSDDLRIRELLADHVLGLLQPETEEHVVRALAASPELRAEADALRAALYALPEALEPRVPTEADWEALRARLHGAPDAAADTAPTEAATAGTPPSSPADAEAAAPTPRPARSHRAPPPRAVPSLTLALSVAVMLLAGTAGWGWIQRGQAALSGREEAVVAYWMRNPDLRITPLEPLSTEHVGVVCVLPDGRAMLLQPHAPAGGRDYVLYGDTAAGRIELGRTRGRLIEFQAGGVQAVELRVEGLAKASIGQAALP